MQLFSSNVDERVPVQVGQFALVPSVALDRLSLLEVSPAVTIQNPRRSARMIGLVGSVGPFRHLRRKDIQIAVAIDVTEIQSVTMDHVTPQQIAAHPGGRVCRIAAAIVKFERAAAVTRCDDDLPVHLARQSVAAHLSARQECEEAVRAAGRNRTEIVVMQAHAMALET